MKLYKKDTKGKIRELELTAVNGKLIQTSGLVEGKKTTRERVCSPKNVGKTNETSAQEQALSELDSKIKKKMREGYFRTQKEAEESEIKLPMLAHSYKDKQNKLEFTDSNGDRVPVFVQAKYDGMRCFAICKNGVVTLISRDNVVIDNLNYINDEILTKVYKEGAIFDGELYVHGENFQTNMKIIKNGREGVKFIIYDYPMEDEYVVRKLILDSRLLHRNLRHLINAPTVKVTSMRDIEDFHAQTLEAGYEGTMIRHGRYPYKFNGRSDQLLKYKDFKDIACKIIAIGPSKKVPNHGRPVVEWVTPDGKTVRFACGTKMTHKQREDLLTNADKYVGKTAEVRYFEEYETGVPRFPVMYGIRLDK